VTPAVDTLLADARIYIERGQTIDGWLAIQGGRVSAIGQGAAPAAEATVDCRGHILLPGLVDMHIHFRDPGHTYKEDFLSGSTAAAFGGVTTVVDMPNTEGQVVTPDDLQRKIDHLRGRSYVDFGLYALLRDSAEYVPGLHELGVAGLKWLLGYKFDQGSTTDLVIPSNRAALRDTMLRAAELGVLVGVHAESYPWLTELREDLQKRGRDDSLAFVESRPPFVEAIAVAEACIVAAEFGCRLHIHHLSSGKGLATALAIKGRLGTRLTIETCPQYLYLTDADVSRLGPTANVNPPIKYAEDVAALWAGIDQYEVDCVATDHAPHSPAEKTTPSAWDARSGLLGVETTFPLLFHEVATGRLSLERFVELTSAAPARILGFHSKGSLLPGHDADIVVVDPQGETTITGANLHSKHPITVYEGMRRTGRISQVLLRGRPVVIDGQLVGQPVGDFLPAGRDVRALAGVR
jgi:allantoinase